MEPTVTIEVTLSEAIEAKKAIGTAMDISARKYQREKGNEHGRKAQAAFDSLSAVEEAFANAVSEHMMPF